MNKIKLDLYPPFKKSGAIITQRISGDEIHSTADLYFSSGKAIQTGTTTSDTLLLQSYDTDGATYITFGTFTAGTTPSFELDNTILDTAVAKGTWTASGTWTIPAVTLGGAVAGGDQTFTNVGDMTFAAGSILASGSSNGNTLLFRANDTTFITLTTGTTDTLDIGAHNISGDVTISGNTATITHSGTTSLTIVSTSGTVTVESVVFTGGAISSATSIAMGGALSGATTIGMAGDLTDYEAVNDGNPEFRIGAADAEELHIQAVYDGGGQTLNYVQFTTDAASATADKGKYVFNVDGSDIATIDDGGIEVTGTVNATGGFTDGTMTIDGSGAITGVTSLAMGGALSGVTTLALSQGITQTSTVTGTLYDMVLETEWTTGTLINADFGGATVQSGNMYGIVFDFNTNLAGVTDQDIIGFQVKTPALDQAVANTTTYIGYSLPTAGACVQSAGAGTITWKGVNIVMPNITQTAGTVNSYGVFIDGGTVTSGTQYALYVNDGNSYFGGDVNIVGQTTTVTSALASGGYALQLTTTSTSTADATTCTGIYNALSSSAIITGTSPYGFTGSYSGVTKTGADTNNSAGLVYAYQGIASQTGSTDVGTRSTYGGYFSATGDANGVSATYGIYATATGADTNWAAYLNGATYIGGDMTFVAGGAIRSGSTNGNTLLIGSNDTTFITITSNATDTCVLASSVTATTQSANDNSTKLATTAYVDTAVGTVNSFAEILALGNTTGANDIVVSNTQGISTALVDDNYFLIKAVDNDPNTASEVARAQGAADPYFSAGGSQQFKFYNSGIAAFSGTATGDAFIDISPTLTGNATTNTYAVNISPVGITIPTGTTAIAASLYVAEPIFTETGELTLGTNVYIDAAPTEGATNYSLYVVGTSYLTGAITAPGGITGNVTGNCTGTSATVTGAEQASITTCANLVSIGTIATGVWQGTTIKANYLQQVAADLGDADINLDFSNTNEGNVTNLTIDGAFVALSLSVGTTGVTTTGTIELGAASDTTISRTGAGAIAVEGVAVLLSGGALGTPASGTLTNCDGTASSLTAGAVTGFTPAGGSLTLAGADALTFTTSAATNVTLPTTGTLLANLVEDTTPELGGELNCGAHSIGFTQQTATGDGTTTINWTLGNKFYFTFGAQADTFTFTAPSYACNLILVLKQDATGSRTATWPNTVKWPGGTAPTLSTGANAVDIVSFYWDGTNYHGNSSLNFSVPA